jgi:hypothetical protein
MHMRHEFQDLVEMLISADVMCFNALDQSFYRNFFRVFQDLGEQ